MVKMNESFEQDQLLNQVLNDYPQAALPAGFVGRVLARIEPAPRPSPFRLQFLDVAVPAFVSLLVVTIILLAAQTDWLPLLLGGKTAVSPLATFHLTPTLTAITLSVIGELALVATLCWRLWDDSIL
jgi:hypothetical protein